MSKNKEILKQTGFYSFGTQIAQAITLIASILSRRFLGPVQTGIWTTLQILVDYSKYSTLGTMDAVSREIPYCIGKGDLEQAERIKNFTASFVLSGSGVIASAIALFAFLTHGRFRPEVTAGLYFVSVIIFLQRLNNLLVALLRCYKRFDIETALMIFSAMVNAFFVGILTYFFKIYGFIWALILSLIFNITFVRSRYAFKFQWNYDTQLLKPLLRFGFPLMLLGLLTTLFRSLDKIMIVKFLGFEALGWYSTALMATAYISNFPISIGIVLLPHFQERYGQRDNPQQMKTYVLKSTLAMALCMPFMIGAVWVFAPPAITLLLPKFTPGIPAMKILTLGMFFIALSQLYYDSLVNIKKHLLLFPILILSSALTVGLDWGAIHFFKNVESVAAATAIGMGIYFIMIFSTACRYFSDFKSTAQSFLSLAAIFLYLILFCTMLNFYQKSGAVAGIKFFLTQCFIFAGFCVPLAWILNHQFSLFAILKSKLLSSKKHAL